MKTSIVLLILTAGISSLAAQDRERPERPQRPDPAQIFAQADTDESGFLDLEELTAFRENMPARGRGGRGGPPAASADDAENDAPPAQSSEGQRGRGGRSMPTAEEMFAFMDKNEDGKIAPDEFTIGNRRGRGGPGAGEGRRAKAPE